MEAIDLYKQRRRIEMQADAVLDEVMGGLPNDQPILPHMLGGIDVRGYMQERERLMDSVKNLPRRA